MQENKLTYLLTKLSAEQRDALIARLGISRTTFYERRNRPGQFTLDEAAAMCRFLEELHGEELDIYHLLNTQVEVLPAKATA